MLFLKILDDKDQELELIRDGYTSVIPEAFQWRTWALDAEQLLQAVLKEAFAN